LTLHLIPRGTEALALLVRYMKLLREKGVSSSPKVRDAVVRHIHDLIALALTEHAPLGESKLTAIAAGRLNVALDCIAAHFQDPELTLSKVAHSVRISPRYLQRLLETSGQSFTAVVTDLRLKRAFMLLTERGEGEALVSDIALRVGFSDISHFNRLFRSRFRDTPSGVRGQADRARRSQPMSS
jgi:AraC-like DNA-binding protein